MAEFSQGLDLAKKSSEKSKILPRYHLTRRADLSLAFDPPIGSRELANALSMKYPLCGSLEQQLQSAILDFIHTEPDESQQHTFTTPQDRRQSLSPVKDSGITDKSNTPNTVKPAHANDFEASTSVWNAITGDPVVSVEKKRKRIKYDRVKRSKVAGVRRSGACDFHRKKKTEVNRCMFAVMPSLLNHRSVLATIRQFPVPTRYIGEDPILEAWTLLCRIPHFNSVFRSTPQLLKLNYRSQIRMALLPSPQTCLNAMKSTLNQISHLGAPSNSLQL
jgi:hypothetical protein